MSGHDVWMWKSLSMMTSWGRINMFIQKTGFISNFKLCYEHVQSKIRNIVSTFSINLEISMFNTSNLASISVFSIHVCILFYTMKIIVSQISQTMFQKYLKHVLCVKKWSRIINNWYYFYLQVRGEDDIWWSIQIVEWTYLKKLRGKGGYIPWSQFKPV